MKKKSSADNRAASDTIRIINLFGDGGRYAGQVNRAATHEVHFWKYYFDDYMSVDPTGEQYRVDKEKLSETVNEIYSGKYSAASCDSNDALLLQYFAHKKGYEPLPFIINDVDGLEMAGCVRTFIEKNYHEDSFQRFLSAPSNLWMHIVQSRRDFYNSLGINKSNLFYLPMCAASIEFVFPDFFKERAAPQSNKDLLSMKNKILAVGSHNRDYKTLVDAVSGTGLEVHVITNLKMNPPIKSPQIVWHDSLPEPEYFQALRNARYIVVPLRDSNRSAGQLACAVPMKLGRVVVAAKGESVGDHVVHGKTGFLYEPGSADSLRKVLLSVEENIGDMAKIENNCREKEKELTSAAGKNIQRLLGKLYTV